MVWEKIRSFKRQGVTVVLTTHYMEEAAQLCDRIVIMDLGKILVEGNPQGLVMEHIGSEVVETENKEDVRYCLAASREKYELYGDMIHVFTGEPKKLISRLYRTCTLGRVMVRQATLEDVFLKLTGKALRE